MTAVYILLGIVYFNLGYAFLTHPSDKNTKRFAILNGVFLLLVLYFTQEHRNKTNLMIALPLTIAYISAIFLHYRLLVKAQQNRRYYHTAFWLPIAVLITYKLLGTMGAMGFEQATWLKSNILFIGISYLTFKLSYSVMELQTGRATLPSLLGYFNYALYVPTLFVGPINPISVQYGQQRSVPESFAELSPHLYRMVVGLLKVIVLAPLVNRLSYEALIVQAPTIANMDYFIAPVASMLYLYFNFAGACDIAIAGSALLGIQVKENFNRPFLARSVQDFWARWHMTLSMYMRDIIFTPFVTWLTGKVGAKYVNHCIAVGIMLIFILIGLWHNVSANFILLGLIHGSAVIFNHYWALNMKSLLGKRYKAIHTHPLVRGFSIAITFCFICVTMLLVSYDVPTFFNYLEKVASILCK